MEDEEMFKTIHELVTSLRKREVTREGIESLERLVLSNKDAARLYVRYIREEQSLRWWSAGKSGGSPAFLDEDVQVSRDPLADAMVMPAIKLEAAPEELAPAPTAIASKPAPVRTAWRPLAWTRWRVAVAAAVLISVTIALAVILRWRQPSPATLAASLDAQWDAPNSGLRPGDTVPYGPVFLISGVAQISFQNGVSMILEAPVRFQIRTDNGADLSLGKLTASVPPAGHGFAVQTDSARIVDLGTEFGVEVRGDGVTDVQVFRGKVQAEPAASQTGAPPSVTLLTEGQSASVSNAGVAVAPIAVAQRFIRSISSGVQSINIVDLIAGGDGTTNRMGVAIDTANGQVEQQPRPRTEANFQGDHQYHHIAGLPALDGCFVPDGAKGPMQVDSAGDRFSFPRTGNLGYARAWAGSRSPWPNDPFRTVLGGVDYSRDGHRLMHVPSNSGITIDLSVARRLHPDRILTQFTCFIGNTYRPGPDGFVPKADAYVIVDGHERFARRGFTPLNGALPVHFPLQAGDHYLTLVTTDGGDGLACDWVVFADPTLRCGDK